MHMVCHLCCFNPPRRMNCFPSECDYYVHGTQNLSDPAVLHIQMPRHQTSLIAQQKVRRAKASIFDREMRRPGLMIDRRCKKQRPPGKSVIDASRASKTNPTLKYRYLTVTHPVRATGHGLTDLGLSRNRLETVWYQ